MHIGHQHLFAALGDKGGIVVIETGYANLTPARERERFSKHPIFYYPLESIRHLDGSAFIAMLKREFPKLQKIVVGYDFHFGKNRQSSYADLKALFDGEVIVIDEVLVHNDSVHSHKIRAKLKLSDVRGANAFLGHNYTIYGDIITGQGLGKKELMPTINLHVKNFLLPQEGVYATLTRIDDEEHYHPSVSFIGHRYSTDGSFAIETHILDAKLTCKDTASISFLDFIRPNQKFSSLEALKEAISHDIKIAKNIINQVSL
ncbi:MAG: bifunctional riboflavin kinase/FAD synthetase [Campylobacterota bacterium]|nr:bifunctional riboflavin kinase/FAD synthetase [Campylobacterota bacterium]